MCSNEAPEGDAVSAELAAFRTRLGELAADPDESVPDAARIDRIRLFEETRSALAAAQQAEMVAFARSQIEAQVQDDRVDPVKVGRGIADQIALACRVAPTTGSRRLDVARVLWAEMPATRAQLITGRISEALAEKIVSQTSHLDVEQRRVVDEQLAGDELETMGLRKAEAQVRRRAYEVDRAGYVARGRKARKDRRVSLRPAPDTMAWLTFLLPVEQGAMVMASLGRHADIHVGHDDEERTRSQVMVDTAVERLTGQERAEDVNVDVNLVIPWDALHPDDEPNTDEPDLDVSDTGESDTGESDTGESDTGESDTDEPGTDAGADPMDGDRVGDGADAAAARPGRNERRTATAMAELVGYGPIPMGIARDILASSRGKLWWRRLFSAPKGGAVVGGDSRRRQFDGFLAHLLGIRDGGSCRDPFCDAPIRHLDHIRQVRVGGPTSLTNGRGVCARGNYVREMPGWRVEVIHDGLHGAPHTVRTTTPTGHTYVSRAGPAP